MAISTLAAVALGVGALGSAAVSAGAASSAGRASRQSADAAAAETRAAREQAYSTLKPYTDAGIPATKQINALLGLGDNTDWAAYVKADPAAQADWQKYWSGGQGALGNKTIQEYGQFHYNNDGQRRDLSPFQNNGQAGFDQFRDSTGYKFRVDQGMNALNSGYAGAGTLKSGAAIKGAVDYGQGMASQEFGNYLTALGNQQSLGYQAGAASAGVGTNAANSLGNIYMQNGENQANASLAKAANINQTFNSLTSGILKYGIK